MRFIHIPFKKNSLTLSVLIIGSLKNRVDFPSLRRRVMKTHFNLIIWASTSKKENSFFLN